MAAADKRFDLAREPDFELGRLKVSPSACRAFAGTEEIKLEAQTMAVLVVLSRAGGTTVSREQLVEACWQGRIVSDDAITRTIAKVRALARGMDPAPFTLETLPKVGYRLTVPGPAPAAAVAVAPPAGFRGLSVGKWRTPVVAAIAAAVLIPVAWAVLPWKAQPPPTAKEVAEALVTLDSERVKDFLARGWNPDWKLDTDGTTALQALMLVCERNPMHDKEAVVRMARQLVAAGATPKLQNKWNDSVLDIAVSPRYCGPTHPVVDYLRRVAPAEEVKRVMGRVCAEVFEGKPTSTDWTGAGLTRETCASVAAIRLKPEEP